MRNTLMLLIGLGLCAVAGCANPAPAMEQEPKSRLLISSGAAPDKWTEPSAQPEPKTDTAALERLVELRDQAAAMPLRMPTETMTRTLQQRVEVLFAARPSLTRLKSSGDPSMVVRGWHFEGSLAWDLAQALRDSETPPGLTPEQIGIYREAIDSKADELEATASRSYGECWSYVEACRGSGACALSEGAQEAARICQTRGAEAAR